TTGSSSLGCRHWDRSRSLRTPPRRRSKRSWASTRRTASAHLPDPSCAWCPSGSSGGALLDLQQVDVEDQRLVRPDRGRLAVGGVPVGLPMGGFFPSFASPGAGGTRLGPLGACGAVVVGVAEAAPPPAGMALVWALPPQPDATRAAAINAVAPARGMYGARF